MFLFAAGSKVIPIFDCFSPFLSPSFQLSIPSSLCCCQHVYISLPLSHDRVWYMSKEGRDWLSYLKVFSDVRRADREETQKERVQPRLCWTVGWELWRGKGSSLGGGVVGGDRGEHAGSLLKCQSVCSRAPGKKRRVSATASPQSVQPCGNRRNCSFIHHTHRTVRMKIFYKIVTHGLWLRLPFQLLLAFFSQDEDAPEDGEKR